MDMRAQVYDSLQNITVWLAAWFSGHETTDNVIDAFTALGGQHMLADATGTVIVLQSFRQRTAWHTDPSEPSLSFILGGPGDPPQLPPAARSLAHTGAIVVRGTDRTHHVAIPTMTTKGIVWHWVSDDSPWQVPAVLTPGEADLALSEATRAAATHIASLGYLWPHSPGARGRVGALSDFYATPGLPRDTSTRSVRLLARADHIAAIIETVITSCGEHRLDPELLGLIRHIRAARMAGVAYAVREFGR